MKQKWLYLIIGLVFSIGIIGLFAHKQKIDAKYRSFTLQKRVILPNQYPIKFSDNLSIQSISQHCSSTMYYATLKIRANRSAYLSTAHWYLNEGPNQQPNQFVDMEINGMNTHTLKSGNNLIKLHTNIDPAQKQHYLVIINNYRKSHYRRLDFLPNLN